MEAIATRKQQSLVKPEDLARWILIDKARLKAQIAAIKALSKMEDGIAAKEAALSDTQDLAEKLLYTEARLGEMLENLKPNIESSGRGTIEKKPSLPEGIDKKQSHYAQELHRNEHIIQKVVEEAREKGEVPVRHHVLQRINTHVGRNSGVSEWYTPPEYIEAARTVMGNIDCDPASSDKANETVGANVIFTEEKSGLSNKWYGNVWMNPPYSQPLISEFCKTFVQKYMDSEIDQGIVLVNNITETDIGQELLSHCAAVCFPNGRVKFLTPDGKPGAPLQGQMCLYFGNSWKKFVKVFSQFGVCLCEAK